jgi:K+ transporter
MNATHAPRERGSTDPRSTGRVALVAAWVMAVAGAGLLLQALVSDARFELVVLAFGLVAGAALIGLLVLTPGLSVTSDED